MLSYSESTALGYEPESRQGVANRTLVEHRTKTEARDGGFCLHLGFRLESGGIHGCAVLRRLLRGMGSSWQWVCSSAIDPSLCR